MSVSTICEIFLDLGRPSEYWEWDCPGQWVPIDVALDNVLLELSLLSFWLDMFSV